MKIFKVYRALFLQSLYFYLCKKNNLDYMGTISFHGIWAKWAEVSLWYKYFISKNFGNAYKYISSLSTIKSCILKKSKRAKMKQVHCARVCFDYFNIIFSPYCESLTLIVTIINQLFFCFVKFCSLPTEYVRFSKSFQSCIIW